MKARMGATFAEFAVLRALRAKGGSAPFSVLALTGVRSIEKVLRGMLPAKLRPNTKGRKSQSGKVRAGRAGLVGKTFRDRQAHYHLTAIGEAGADFYGPWILDEKSGEWRVEWTPAGVLVTGRNAEIIGRIGEQGMDVAGVISLRSRPDKVAWTAFRKAMKERHGVVVPVEAVPDFLRFSKAFFAAPVTPAEGAKKRAAARKPAAQV